MKQRMIGYVRHNRLFFLFVTILMLKGSFYAAFAIPLRLHASSDDVGHVSYVIYLAEEHKTPILFETEFEKNAYQNFLDSYVHYTVNTPQYQVNTSAYESSTGHLNWIAQHPPLYYIYLLPFYQITKLFTNKLSVIVLILRIATLPLSVITFSFFYKSLRMLNIENTALKCAMICFVFSSATQFYLVTITNDAMLICLSSIAFFYFLKYLKKNHAVDIYIFAVVCAFITITKFTGAVLLPVYALAYLYHTLRIQKMCARDFCKQSLICVILFCAVSSPVLIQNYMRYSLLFPTYDDNTKLFAYSLSHFLLKSAYLDEIVSHLICFTGWRRWIVPDTAIKCTTEFLLLTVYWIKHQDKCLLKELPVIIAFILTPIINKDYLTVLVISTVLCILFDTVTACKEKVQKFDREACGLSVIMIVFYMLTFLVQHYIIYLHRGYVGATHGRYYYPLICPFFYILLGNLDEYENKVVKYIPLWMLALSLSSELVLMCRGVKLW